MDIETIKKYQKTSKKLFFCLKKSNISFIKIKILLKETDIQSLIANCIEISKIVKKMLNYHIIPIIYYDVDCSIKFLKKVNSCQILEFNNEKIPLQLILYSFNLNSQMLIKNNDYDENLKEFIKMLNSSLVPAISFIFVKNSI